MGIQGVSEVVCNGCGQSMSLAEFTDHDDPVPIMVGLRVRLTGPVDRYPHFLADAGMTGTVTEVTPDLIAVTMDERIPGAEEWDNAIHWYPQNGAPQDDLWADAEVLDRTEGRP